MFFISMLLSFFLSSEAVVNESAVDILTATSVAGYWVGENYQEKGGYRSTYDIEMHLVEKDGKITGKSYVKVDDIFAEIQLVGTFTNGSVLVVKDTEISEKKIKPGMEWCMKNYFLILKKRDNEWLLEGHWNGSTSFSTCTPGKVLLRKGIFRA